MADFDPRAYEDQVLKPLRRRLPHLPDDLLTRYAVEATMDHAALGERIANVVRVWNKAALKAGPTGLVCQQLLREHEELTRRENVDLTSPRWWRSWQQTHHQQLGGQIAELAELLRASHGELGVITRNQLRAAAAAHPTLGDAEIDQAAASARLRLVEPLELPKTAGMRGRLENLTTKLLTAGVDSIPRLLFPQLSTFGLLGAFTVTPPSPGREVGLSQQVAEQRAAELDTAPDSPVTRAQREAVGILVSAAKDGTDLTALALFHLLQPVREAYAQGAQPRTLFTLLTRSGLRQADAGRIVVSVLAESAESGTRRDPLAAVTSLLAGGGLLAAQQLAITLDGPPGERAREAVAHQREQVESLRRAAAADLRAGREGQAATRLREALRLAADLPGLAEQLATVPTTPVEGVTVSAQGTGVHIGWRLAPEHGEQTTVRVLRREDREPLDVEDGHEIPVRSRRSSADEAPPVGRRVHYAVFARTTGGQWSRPVCAVAQVVPPVTDVVIEGGNNVITGRWRVHPEVLAVEVHRSAGVPECPGEPVVVQRNRAFRDASAVDGMQYCYTLRACYPPPGGGAPLRSAPVVVRGATRPPARPLAALRATPAAGVGLGVRLSWSQRPGSEIVIRRCARPCPWEYGQVVALAELAGYGVELDGTLTEKGESRTLLAPMPPGRSYCVPFTLGAGGALRGQDAVVDLLDPVRQLRAQRFGEDVRVTWRWPEQAGAADVQWAGGGRRITRQQYREEGGCQLRAAPGTPRVEVNAVLLSESGESRSATASVLVEQRPPELTYQLRRCGHRLLGGLRCVVTLCGARPVAGVTLIIVAAVGHALPASPEAGVELLRRPVVIDPEVPVVLEAPVPRLRKPYWLRCFLAEPAPALLLDPPLGQLKVS
ncbi:MAG: hypothetical protein JO115_04165 [Pseudonocardiales bacterium]|nr:hypothetical protein [Pseudonocardiales bacterium]